MRPRFTGLWRHPEFQKLWAGQTLSSLGSQITGFALPLTAILLLGATPGQMGLLAALQYAPFLLVTLVAGAWVDRLPRLRILVAADLGRALLLGSIPAAALFGMLGLEHLYAAAFLTGVLTVCFNVADQAFLPTLLRREELIEGNSKLAASRAVAQVAGPGLGGWLVQVLTAPMAIALDAASFLGSALCLGLIRARPTEDSGPRNGRTGLRGEVAEGLRLVLSHPLLRPIAGAGATHACFTYMMLALVQLYALSELDLTPAVLGGVLAVGGLGVLPGAALARSVALRLGVGTTLAGATLLDGFAILLMALAGGPLAPPAVLLAAGLFAHGLAIPLFDVNQVSLRQALTPDRLQGRMNATMKFLIMGAAPLGAFTGGLLAEQIGLRPTLLVAAVGAALASFWVLFSSLRALREPPERVQEPAPAVA
jgi:MFS family permease